MMNTHPNPPEPPRPPAVPPPLEEPNTTPRPDDQAAAEQAAAEQARLEDMLDRALANTFPASDPVSSLTADDPVQARE